MKNLLKTAAIALVIAIAAISCDPPKSASGTNAVDSLKKDSTIKVDSTKKDTTTTTTIVKKDSVKK